MIGSLLGGLLGTKLKLGFPVGPFVGDALRLGEVLARSLGGALGNNVLKGVGGARSGVVGESLPGTQRAR